MHIYAKVIEDSISSERCGRLTTIEIQLPKVLLAELNTHRVFSRNFSSSRAIPTAKLINSESFYPLYWGKNKAGMQSAEERLTTAEEVEAKQIWEDTIKYCKGSSEKLQKLGLHKQWTNRLNDWHIMAKGIVTSTDWSNFFALRDHPDAQPEIRQLARDMRLALINAHTEVLSFGEWHLPYVTKQEREEISDLNILKKISAARCCRVSYLKHDNSSSTIEEDIALCDKLAGSKPIHASPMEHQATPDYMTIGGYKNHHLHGNFVGWIQNRKMMEQEALSNGRTI